MGSRWLLLCVVVLLLSTPAVAKKKRRSVAQNDQNTIHGRKRECEDECADTHEDDRPNCVLRCQSETCYSEVYLPEELEPGEIDLGRQKTFQNCLNRENREANRQARRRAAEPTPAASEQQQDSTEL